MKQVILFSIILLSVPALMAQDPVKSTGPDLSRKNNTSPLENKNVDVKDTKGENSSSRSTSPKQVAIPAPVKQPKKSVR